ITQHILISPQEKVLSETYPLMRRRMQAVHTPFKKQPNVLIVLLEGWNPHYVDALGHQNFGVTPVFDDIVQHGIVFTNAYAVGQRSIFGFAAVLGSIPLVPGLPMFGYGLEMTSMSPMPSYFAQKGYYTFFAQTSHRDSYRLCALASYLGMQDSFGWEDIPQKLTYEQKAPFGYDYDMLQFAADKIAQHKHQPFMGMVFTGITHEPFVSTLPQFNHYPNDTWEHGFLNSLSYADWSIGEFLARAKKDGWFEDTIFVFVSDHTSGPLSDGTLKRNFHIPLVIYAPAHYSAQQVGYVVSQLDIVPTLYNMAGLTPTYTAFGRDMFDKTAPRLALVAEGSNVGLITQQGGIRHTGSKLLTVEPYSNQFNAEQAQETLLALTKTAYTLLKENRWYDPQLGAKNE
ncbi:MAG: LTA synthase family protein, partial [Elusimicrobiaceae bacterium]|nr:LTA synthase family protein [Elusimicrobiaceae bacterium]